MKLRPLKREEARRHVDIEKERWGWTYHGTLGFLDTVIRYLFPEEGESPWVKTRQ